MITITKQPSPHTRTKPITAITVMKVAPPLPKAKAYNWTKGCGAFKENKTSKSGVQNKNKMMVTKLSRPVAIALDRIPFPATILYID